VAGVERGVLDAEVNVLRVVLALGVLAGGVGAVGCDVFGELGAC
jgi:hypothetical protein